MSDKYMYCIVTCHDINSPIHFMWNKGYHRHVVFINNFIKDVQRNIIKPARDSLYNNFFHSAYKILYYLTLQLLQDSLHKYVNWKQKYMLVTSLFVTGSWRTAWAKRDFSLFSLAPTARQTPLQTAWLHILGNYNFCSPSWDNLSHTHQQPLCCPSSHSLSWTSIKGTPLLAEIQGHPCTASMQRVLCGPKDCVTNK